MPLEARPRTPLTPELALSPPFVAVRLRELGDAFAHAISVAGEQGAGTLVYVGRFDLAEFAVTLESEEPLAVALAEAMQRWIAHVIGVEVMIEPLSELREAPLIWYVGLDAEATRIGDRMWNGEDIDETAMARVVGLFALTFRDQSLMLDKVKDEPVYPMLAITRDRTIRMKPQNLATGLPIKHLETVG